MRRMAAWAVLIAMVCGYGVLSRARAAQGGGDGPPGMDDNGGGGNGPGGNAGAGGNGGGQRGGPPGLIGDGRIHIIPPFAMRKLDLTDQQKSQLADLEKETYQKLSNILTADQMKTLAQARPPRPGMNGGQRRGDGGEGGGGQRGGGNNGGPPDGNPGGPDMGLPPGN